MTDENISTEIGAEDGAPFVVEGVISELHVSYGKQNLLQQLDKHYKGKSALTGLGAIAGDMYGQVANSAMLAMYDGEDTENFICLIDDQVLCGTFGGASKLPVGQKVKAVVLKQGDVLKAQGIISESMGLVWLSYPLGWKAERAANFKLAWWLFVWGIVGTLLFSGIMLGYGTNNYWEAFKISFFGGGAILLVLAFWNSSTMNALADPATEVFRMLGFAEPEKVNLNSYRYGIVHFGKLNERQAQHLSIHCYKKAVEDGKVKMAPSPSA